jgi:hypothetical protein
MVSPVGAGAEQTFTSVRAGICRMRELPEIYVCLPENDAVDEPDTLVGSAIYHLADDARRAGRMAEWLAFLAAQAYRDLLRRARLEDADPSRLAVFLSVPTAAEPRSCEEIIRHFHNFAGLDPLRHVELVCANSASALPPWAGSTPISFRTVSQRSIETGESRAAETPTAFVLEKPLVFCDLDGESTRAKEWSYAVSRLGQRFQNHRLEHPASILGDLGAATGAVLAALAVQYLGARRMDRTHAIVWAGSDDGERRAMLLQRSRE